MVIPPPPLQLVIFCYIFESNGIYNKYHILRKNRKLTASCDLSIFKMIVVLVLKMVTCNETETSTSSPVHTVRTHARVVPEDHDNNINYENRENLPKKIK